MRNYVWVEQNLFDQSRQHCENCQNFKRKFSSVTKHSPKKRLRIRIETAINWILQKASKVSDWRTRQTELDLKTVEQYESVIRAFGNVADIRREASYENANSEHELIHLAERLALLTKKSLKNAEFQRFFALFQTLILLSYCEILKKRHVSFHEIDRIIEHLATNEKDRKTILNDASRINEIINELIDNNWTIYRATELFFIRASSELIRRGFSLFSYRCTLHQQSEKH